jgi:hypothetical protein
MRAIWNSINCISFCLLTVFGYSQSWQTVGGGTSQQVRYIMADTEDNLLHVVGQFQFADTLEVRGYAIWDGSEWTAPTMFSNYCSFGSCSLINRIEKFEGQLFASGGFNNEDGKYLMKWDDTAWEPSGNPNKPGVLSKTNEQLFFTGYFDTISDVYANRIALWNGIGWVPFGTPLPFVHGDGWSIVTVTYYNNEYYCSGNFSYSNNFKEIVRWNGSEWNSLSSGILGDSWVNRTIVYNDMLFVAGYFSTSDGNVSNHLMAWNGESWINPFPDVNFISQVTDLKIIDGELYIVGGYTLPDMCCIYYIGKYDGTNFCTFGGFSEFPDFNSSIGRIAGLHGKIYISGTFVQGQSIGHIASIPIDTPSEECIVIPSLTGVEKQVDFPSIFIHPNPSTHTVYLSSPDLTPGSFVRIYNLSGQLVYEQNVLEQSERLAIATALIAPPGMYLVQLHAPGKAMAVQKLVVAD